MAQVIGQGAFGVVVLGQYRGTKVAVKRVLPLRGSKASRGSTKAVELEGENEAKSKESKGSSNGDVESQSQSKKKSRSIEMPPRSSVRMSGSGSSGSWNFRESNDRYNVLKALDSATTSSHGSMLLTSGSSVARFLPLPLWLRFDEHSQLRKDFIVEMRLLSRLRHPCITTVMGAVIESRIDPMLVMEYMDHGSLYDLLHNDTMYTGGEVILQIIRDIVQGLQFLHASKPPILHGDLKAKNILVDSRFRAKVADFGFSHIKQKKTAGIRGTPFYMAPEYVRGKHEYTAACDIYSIGMVIFEIYGREEPFEGEDPKQLLPKICHPRLNKRPNVPEACPPKMAEIMKKCWAANAFFRPSARDLDYLLVEMSAKDAEPLGSYSSAFKANAARKPASLYDMFPKHIADALNAGKAVEPQSHEIVTVVFSDIVGFTEISQSFSAMKVSNMLDRLYQAFDKLASKHKVFKVETIGDAYMGVTNLEENEFETHVKQVAEFAIDAVAAASKIIIDEDAPNKGCVAIRVGFHSGSVVSNVIGSLNPRYGLFGDTVNTASRMESTSLLGRIHCSYASAKILQTQAPKIPLVCRGNIEVKGKGRMKTFWVGDHQTDSVIVEVAEDNSSRSVEEGHSDSNTTANTKETEISISLSEPIHDNFSQKDSGGKVTSILLNRLRELVKSRHNTVRTADVDKAIKKLENNIGQDGRTILEEATDYVLLPPRGFYKKDHTEPSDTAVIDTHVQHQLFKYVAAISNMHSPKNPFHSFDHCSAVVTSAQEMLTHIVAPQDAKNDCDVDVDSIIFNDRSFGIYDDQLSQFALVFASCIHDVDHQGIPNFCLARENSELNLRYKGKALAEQNAADLAFEIFMSPDFDKLRACIYTTPEEFMRFRQIVINIVVATDIFDPDLVQRRTERWGESFGSGNDDDHNSKTTIEEVSRQASNVLEHLMQASDIRHTMQDWHIYQKWNERLFAEMTLAHQNGRMEKDPANGWYQGELAFLDKYVIPLANSLQVSGIFDETWSNQLLQNAIRNRGRWASEGKKIVAFMSLKVKSKDEDDLV